MAKRNSTRTDNGKTLKGGGLNETYSKNGRKNSQSGRNTNRKRGTRDNSSESRATRNGYSDKYPYAEGSNDATYYKGQNPGMVADAANLSFAWPLGSPVPLGLSTLPTNGVNTHELGGLLTIELAPTVGWSVDMSSPLNTAALSAYIFIRKNKAGTLPFDAADLACYNICMCDVYSYINFLERVYAHALDYSQENKYIPRALLEAEYVDPDDLNLHLADFRYGVNLLIDQARSIAAPANIDLYKRRAMLYQNYYIEGTSIKDQMYMYVPAGFMTLAAGDTGTRCSFKRYAPFATSDTQLYTVNELIQYGLKLISAIRLGSDIQTISAFIYSAYEPGNLLQLENLSEDYRLRPVFDIAVLEQMRNANIIPETAVNAQLLGSLSITQVPETGELLAFPQIQVTGTAAWAQTFVSNLARNRFLSTTTNKVDVDLILDSTRLMWTTEAVSSGNVANVICGSELPLRCYTYRMNNAGSIVKQRHSSFVTSMDTGPDAMNNTVLSVLSRLATIVDFKFRPSMCWDLFIMKTGDNKYTYQSTLYMDDTDNFAVLTYEDIKRIHNAVIMNQLNVPRI